MSGLGGRDRPEPAATRDDREITEQLRKSVRLIRGTQDTHRLLERRGGTLGDYVFSNRNDYMAHMSTRQYARLVREWIVGVGLQAEEYGTHSLRPTNASIVYKAADNLRAVEILLGHAKIESTVRYLGVVGEDALELTERTEV